jgi:glycosyltransferase involved in cell wall biosynthesis
VFALPSEIDKSPYSVLEAMFAGLPVVSTNVGGIPEMVVDGETGYLVPPDDDVAIADAIEKLLTDDTRRVAMGHASRARAYERFDARKTTADLIGIIAEARDLHAG